MKSRRRSWAGRLFGAAVCLLLALALSACATTSNGRPLHDDNPPGTWHVVGAGETSAKIAQDAGIPLEDLLEINGLRRGQALQPGRMVYVLRGSPETKVNPSQPTIEPAPTAPDPVEPVVPSEPARQAPLRWPVTRPVLTSLFGKRWGREHEGIDMKAPTGTPVLAAADGEVLYAGNQVRGYGNMVVLQHQGNILTVYAHNSLLLVRTGDHVSVGKEIARVGDTGHSTAPHLHFEVRRGEIPQDPLPFLPALK
ncbi:MAG TPA: LysM peptidoglycan-binding domain-containing M23 family metallopeptidase [Polyangia bacterium]